LQASYLIAADGAGSRLRARVGISQDGQAVPGVAVSALFHADLHLALRGRQVGALLA
jgi:2-polyprenyl-6-methoxyphenol hydroxylase-like FAD-dependent oxidoreductase